MYDQTILDQKYLYLGEHGNYYMYCPYPRLSDYKKDNEYWYDHLWSAKKKFHTNKSNMHIITWLQLWIIILGYTKSDWLYPIDSI